jgi:hypothetical protein
MGYYDIPQPEKPVRAFLSTLRERAREGMPTFVSIALNRGARERPRVVHAPSFRTARGETVSPASTQLRAGPIIVTVVWPARDEEV